MNITNLNQDENGANRRARYISMSEVSLFAGAIVMLSVASQSPQIQRNTASDIAAADENITQPIVHAEKPPSLKPADFNFQQIELASDDELEQLSNTTVLLDTEFLQIQPTPQPLQLKAF